MREIGLGDNAASAAASAASTTASKNKALVLWLFYLSGRFVLVFLIVDRGNGSGRSQIVGRRHG